MFTKFSQWLRTKTGMASVAIVVVLAVVAAGAGTQLGWFGGTGAAGVVAPDPATCGLLPTSYKVENPSVVPYAGVKYTFTSGQAVKLGAIDNFAYTVPADVLKNQASILVNVQARPYSYTFNFDKCAFTGSSACPAQQDGGQRFTIQFKGSKDNGDGTYTVNWAVQVWPTNQLTYVAFALPNGASAISPKGTYAGQTCPTQ